MLARCRPCHVLGHPRLGFAARPAAGALAYLRARRAHRRGARPRRLGRYLAAEQRIFEEVRTEVTQKLERGRAGPGQPLFRGQPGLSRPLRRRLEPLPRAGAGRRAGGRGRAAARADRCALQPAAHRRALPRPRLRRDHPAPAGPRHRAGGAGRGGVGGLGGGDPARGPRGAPARRPGQAAAPGRLLERRRARDAVRARCHRGSRARAARPAGADLADDRHHRVRALRRASPAGPPSSRTSPRRRGSASCRSSSRSSTTRSRSTVPANPSSSPVPCRSRSAASPATTGWTAWRRSSPSSR